MMRPDELVVIRIFEWGRSAPLVHELDGGEWTVCSPTKDNPTYQVVGGLFFDSPSRQEE